MADAYWRFNESRQPPAAPIVPGKRPRPDFDGLGSHDMSSYYGRGDDRVGTHGLKDTDSIEASYDRYLRNAVSSYGGEPARPFSGPRTANTADDPRVAGVGAMNPVSSMGLVGARPVISLPPDASSTLFLEGLPSNCSRREVAHIFRPFVGYKEVRLVSKEARNPGGDPLLLCFVDFATPAHAATAMDALQGYQFDEHDRESVILRLQFARYPGARSGGGMHRGKR